MADRLGLKQIALGALFLLGIFSLFSVHPGKEDKIKENLRKENFRILGNYSFDPKSPIIQRATLPPDFVLRYLKELDGKEDYIPYLPQPAELEAIDREFSRLPGLHRQILKKRAVGIYFIKNFTGNGLTEWVLDKDDNIYFFMVFNYSVLVQNMNQTVSERISSVFKSDPAWTVEVDISRKESALFYLLLHEGTHGVDYVLRIQEYVDPQSFYFQKKMPMVLDYQKGIWKSYALPQKGYDFPLRDKITFYGLSKGPLLEFKEAGRLYSGFEKSVFPSLYGSLSWAEDLAESLTLYHVTQKLNLPYNVTIRKNQKIIHRYSLQKQSQTMGRIRKMEFFYSPEKYSNFLPKE